MMLDDEDYIVIGKLIPRGEAAGRIFKGCYVSFTYVMKIGTYTHAQHVHTYAHTGGWRERKRESGERGTYTHAWIARGTHARVNRYGRVCQVIMKIFYLIYIRNININIYIYCFRLFC